MLAHGFYKAGRPYVTLEPGPGDKAGTKSQALRPNSLQPPHKKLGRPPAWKWHGGSLESSRPLSAALLALVANDAAALAMADDFTREWVFEVSTSGFMMDVDEIRDFVRSRLQIGDWD